ncbi:hypothetical protein AVEN_166696-1 [Araneus ventricosus]|uniref:Reverse transcriptase domain-containing protein n=1 Tax=Araneus ventricosus TaxID=182803 RepID=A0A4Y2KHD7_ARAVE|nr:hypothetical protein AVEN_166696-1 [Araneus ventricosus]
MYYKKEYAIYKAKIKEAKDESIKKYMKSIIQKTNIGLIKNVINNKSLEISIDRIRKENGELTQTPRERTGYVIKSQFQKIINVKGDLNNLHDIDVEDFTIAEIRPCLGSMKRKTAPGPDWWSLDFWLKAFYLNFSLSEGFFPETWKIAGVVLIPTDAKDLSEVTSYRPICLLPV